MGWGWALIQGWALIIFFCLWDGRLFEVGANSRLGAYSNKYGISEQRFFFFSTSVSQKRKIIDCEKIPAVNSGTPNSVVTTLTNIENIIRRTYWYAITEEAVWRLLRKNRVR